MEQLFAHFDDKEQKEEIIIMQKLLNGDLCVEKKKMDLYLKRWRFSRILLREGL